MRRLILLVTALSFICMPLLAQESDSDQSAGSGESTEFADSGTIETTSGAGSDSTGGCGSINFGAMGEAPSEEEPVYGTDGGYGYEEGVYDDGYYGDGTGTGVDGAGLEGGQPPATNESQAGSEMADGTCDLPNPDGTLTCYQGGVALDCFCCDASDQPVPCNDVDPPCCLPPQ